MQGKKVGVWCCGNEPTLRGAAEEQDRPLGLSAVTIVNQPFDMQLFLRTRSTLQRR
jgi:hypothetical protein